MKRILIIHPSLGLGGAEKIIAFLANTLCKKYEVKLFLLKMCDKTIDMDNQISIETVECYSERPIIGKKFIKGLKDLKVLIEHVKNSIGKFEPEVIICFDLRVLLATYIANKKYKRKIVFSERADPYANPKYWKCILKNIYKKIEYVVFQTIEAQACYGRVVEKKSSVIANPALLRHENVYEVDVAEKKYIFSAGRFQYRKGFDILVKAFAQINECIEGYYLVLYGSGAEEEKLRQIAKDLHVEERVIFKTPINNVMEKNRNADLFVLPSRSEGIPNILLEAMLLGIPCVASDCSPGGARLLSADGQYCLLAENDNVNSLAQKMLYALNNFEETVERKEMAKRSMSRFSPDVIAEKWFDVIERVI